MWDDMVCRYLFECVKMELDSRRLAIVKGAAMPNSGAWLKAIPNPSIGTFLDRDTVRIAVALRVGAHVCVRNTSADVGKWSTLLDTTPFLAKGVLIAYLAMLP